MRDFNEFDVGDGEIISINNTEPGYQLHLKGVGTLLRLYLRSSTSRSFVIASALNKLQPNNPFFELLSKGPSIELEEKLLQLCPSESSKLDFLRFQWSWERKDSEEAWRQTMGWDCIFISKLLRNYDSLLPRP
ncbi:MAG: hypothetical protein EOP48_07700 [Sphingobacteriales bacterium]|nr:MAG: hypothetical protein EOP48_07700 [Sphingobacteriales bacterium]